MKKIFLFLMFFSSLVFSRDVKFYTPSFSCNGIKKGMPEYIICTNQSIAEYYDIELYNAYRKLLEIVPPNQIEQIKETQRHWVRNKQRKCKTQSCFYEVYRDRIKEIKYLYSKDKIFTEDFKYYGTSIHPGCIYDLLAKLNGDHIVKKVDLTNCIESNKYSNRVDSFEIVTINNKKYIRALVDDKEMYTQYHLVKYLGHGLYEFEIMSYPAKSGTIVSKEKIIVKLDKDSFYTSIWSDGQDYIYKKDYLELQLLLNITDRDGAKLKQQYEKIKQKIINKYSQKGDK